MGINIGIYPSDKILHFSILFYFILFFLSFVNFLVSNFRFSNLLYGFYTEHLHVRHVPLKNATFLPRLESLEEVDFHESGTFATLHKLVSTTTIADECNENLDSYS